MQDMASAPEALQDFQKLKALSSPAAPSHGKANEPTFGWHDKAHYDISQDLEIGNDRGDVESQKSTVHTALSDLLLVSQSSSIAESTETSTETVHRHIPTSDESAKRVAPGSATTDGGGTTLSFRFGSILALISGLIQKLNELPEGEMLGKELAGPKLPYTKLRDVIAFLEGCMLDLRIWSKDLNTNNASALDRLDDMKDPENGAAVVITFLHENMTEVHKTLLPLASRLRTRPSSESPSVRPYVPVEQPHRVDMDTKSGSTYSDDLLSLSMACARLKDLLENLLAQKSEIKEILALLPTERLAPTEYVASESKAAIVPSILSFGA